MFVSVFLLAAAQQIVIPLDRPKQIEQPRAPIQTSGPLWASKCAGPDAGTNDWEKPAPPVRIHGNTYLVGTCGISSVLITDPAGHILIDGGTEADADLIADNVRKLGFRVTDIKYLLNSHEHFDHAGGLAKLQRLSGAQLVASPAAAKVLNSGVAAGDDPQAGILKPFAAGHVDRVIADGEIVRMGNVLVTAVATPGHTAGATTWRWGSCDAGVCRQIVYADSLSPVSAPSYRFSAHPALVATFRSSIAKVAKLECDILLTPHPGASNMPQRLALGRPLLDTNACRNYATALTKRLDDRLAEEKGKKAAK